MERKRYYGERQRGMGSVNVAMRLSTASPVAALRDYVRGFEQREASIKGAVAFPLAARPEQFLEFYVQGKYFVQACGSEMCEIVPSAVVVGPSTHRRADLVLHGS